MPTPTRLLVVAHTKRSNSPIEVMRMPRPRRKQIVAAGGHLAVFLLAVSLLTGEVEWSGWFGLAFLALVTTELVLSSGAGLPWHRDRS